MEEEMEASSVIFHEFLLEFKKNKSTVYCFVEGSDDIDYYRPRIEAYVSWSDNPYIPCSGKRGVIGIFEIIKGRREFEDCKILYFVDRDFDDNSQISDEIYVTPSYSIENLYTSTECFCKALKYVIKRKETDQDFGRAIELFQQRKDEFHEIVSDLNALIASDREINSEVKNRKSINGIKITDYMNISIDKISVEANFADLLDLFNHIDSEKKDEVKSRLVAKDRQLTFRGKFELQFYAKFLDLLIRDSNVRKDELRKFFKERVKTQDLDVTKSPVQVLSSYAMTPICLQKYINTALN